MPCDTLKKTPLHEKHVELSGRMVPFSGWSMPVQYTGIIEEHLNTRSGASIFDICHMGEFFITGPGAACDVERLVTRKVKDMPAGRCRYGFLLNENAGIIDDLIVFRISQQEYMLVVNAGTREKDAAWIRKNLSSSDFSDRSDEIAKIDVQGPDAPMIVNRIFGDDRTAELKRFNFIIFDWDSVWIILSATGYTGEKGYEIFLPASGAVRLWELLLGAEGVKPAGLGARDSLRLEAGYPLYGHDIDEEHTPFEANLGRFVDMDKDFIGKKALLDKGDPSRVLQGFICEGRRAAREGFRVLLAGKESGRVTSGVFSPCLKRGIGLCYIDAERAGEGGEVTLTDGRVEIKAALAKPPFVKLNV